MLAELQMPLIYMYADYHIDGIIFSLKMHGFSGLAV